MSATMYCRNDSSDACVVRLASGEIAPFDGVLSSPRIVAETHVRAAPEYVQSRVDAAVKRERALHAVEMAGAAKAWDEERESILRRADQLAEESESVTYLPYVALIAIGIGILAGVGISSLRGTE